MDNMDNMDNDLSKMIGDLPYDMQSILSRKAAANVVKRSMTIPSLKTAAPTPLGWFEKFTFDYNDSIYMVLVRSGPGYEDDAFILAKSGEGHVAQCNITENAHLHEIPTMIHLFRKRREDAMSNETKTDLMKAFLTVIRRFHPKLNVENFTVIYREDDQEVISLVEYMNRLKHEGGGGPKQVRTRLRFNDRVYVVRKNDAGLKYIVSDKSKLFLSDIKGRYRYVK